MNFSFGGSTGKYWNQFSDKWSMGGEGGKLWTSLTTGWQGLKDNKTFNKWGNEAVNIKLLGQKEGVENLLQDQWKGKNGKTGLQEWYMDKSRKLSPFWEGGLTDVGGSTKQFFKWGEDVALKASHHLSGTHVEGYGSRYSSSASTGSGSALVDSDAENPSLINQGNWQRPGELESFLRREEQVNRGVLAHDLTKTQRGRQKVETLA